ncbi:hypothetical protein RFM26_04310 [Mesorhizobium sp. VK23B]|uniref:Uncharacterized protein n=1 Tax=Mesorhizobium dulcispinae TaxID=3072316 RepID=A0ABU4XGG3_9HYPH|nr:MULTISPECIES: hypothetical protein [unclassified Mesorhizobium]MDX8464903.1 hypothetical protein [Mesorhizobium sp. VK23B]MDX8472880.1 hypothetical protein [Mesorhizobium sp. VK23A]
MPDNLVRVYRPDGSLQCGLGRGRTLKEDQQVLSALGGHVLSAEKRTIPVRVPQVCGAPTGRTNTYVIKAKEWELILRSFVGPAGFAEWTYDAPTTGVFKYDGTLQCGLGQEIPLAEMTQELVDAGVSIISSHKSSDGLMHIQLCGALTGQINVYEIATPDLYKALQLGFAPLASIPASAATGASLRDGLPVPWPFPW